MGLIESDVSYNTLRLRAGILQSVLFYDFYASDNVGIKIGAGPAFTRSNLRYTSYLEGVADVNGTTAITEIGTNTRQSNGMGFAIEFRIDMAIDQSFIIYFNAMHRRFKNDVLTSASVGLGYRL